MHNFAIFIMYYHFLYAQLAEADYVRLYVCFGVGRKDISANQNCDKMD